MNIEERHPSPFEPRNRGVQEGRGGLVINRTILFRRTKLKPSSNFHKYMKILRVVGLGLAIIILRLLVPDIFHALEKTLLEFFNVLGTALSMGSKTLSAGAFLPQMPQLPPF